MKLVMITTVLAMLTGPALADPAPQLAPCERGVAYAKAGDLPRAAWLLEGCSGPEAERAAAVVATRLRASELSSLTVASSEPVPFETDALPHEHLVAPATIWAKPGVYTIHTATGEITATVPPHARATLLLTVPSAAPAAPPKTVSFIEDEPTDPPVIGSPAAIKHPSMLPCKYDGCDTHSGDELVDPLARVEARGPIAPPDLRFGLRLGIAGSDRVAPSVAASAHWRLLAMRLDRSPRGAYDDVGLAVGVSRVIFAPAAAWVSAGIGLRGDVRLAKPMTTAHYGAGATADVELALRALPVTLGARYDQGFAGDHAIVVELGFDVRL